jgi:hypothetical protein
VKTCSIAEAVNNFLVFRGTGRTAEVGALDYLFKINLATKYDISKPLPWTFHLSTDFMFYRFG